MDNLEEEAKAAGGKWIYSGGFRSDEDNDYLDEGGGSIRYCSYCEAISQPNRPCFCGAVVVMNSSGKYWAKGDVGGWVEDKFYKAEHFSASSAKVVAEAIGGTVVLLGEQGLE